MSQGNSRKITVAAVQVSSGRDVQANLGRCLDLLAVAAGQGAGIACFPELAHLPWVPAVIDDAGFGLAEPVDGPAIAAVRAAAAEHGISAVFPFFELDGGARYNSTAVIRPDGGLAGVYRKAHVPQLPRWEERHYFSPGDRGFPVFDVAGLRIGVQTSWDNLFPEGSRALALAGAQLIVAPSSSCGDSHDLWLRAISANALFNGVYCLRVNRVGGEPGQVFYGRSFMVDPHGDLSGQEAGEAEGVMLSDIFPEALTVIRREFPLLRERRPDLYCSICAMTGTKAVNNDG